MRDPLVVALTRLIEREGGRTNVADEIKSSDQTLYQIAKGVKDSKSGTPKGVGPSLRKRLDERYPGWRLLGESQNHEAEIATPKSNVVPGPEQPPLKPSHSSSNNFKHAPIVVWACLGDDLRKPNDNWPAEAMRAIYSTKPMSGLVKWVEVVDDLLAPRVLRGDLVVVDPDGKPMVDSPVLVRLSDGTHVLRFYRPLAGDAFEVFDGAGRTMDSVRHGIVVAATFVTLSRDSV